MHRENLSVVEQLLRPRQKIRLYNVGHGMVRGEREVYLGRIRIQRAPNYFQFEPGYAAVDHGPNISALVYALRSSTSIRLSRTERRDAIDLILGRD